jgi:hypothetical protein
MRGSSSIWRLLRFNRNPRKVNFHWKGKPHVENRDDIMAHFKVQFSVYAGAEHLPMPGSLLEFGDSALKELREQYKLFPLWKAKVSLLTKVFNIMLLLPFVVVWSAITYPTEVFYYFFEKSHQNLSLPSRGECP